MKLQGGALSFVVRQEDEASRGHKHKPNVFLWLFEDPRNRSKGCARHLPGKSQNVSHFISSKQFTCSMLNTESICKEQCR